MTSSGYSFDCSNRLRKSILGLHTLPLQSSPVNYGGPSYHAIDIDPPTIYYHTVHS